MCSRKEDVFRVCHDERQNLCPGAWLTAYPGIGQSMSKHDVGTPVQSPLYLHMASHSGPSGYLMHRCEYIAHTLKLCLLQQPTSWASGGLLA